jgi:DNA-binding PucR family transcriptional regulator
MAGDVDEFRRFVTEVPGDLGVDHERNEWLPDTLREFLACNHSFVATADAMILYRNTIQYRVVDVIELCCARRTRACRVIRCDAVPLYGGATR